MSTSAKPPGILLDTSFLLPTLGITVRGIPSALISFLTKFAEGRIYYSGFSILESLWMASSIPDEEFDGETFQLGLRSIIEGHRYVRVEEDSEIFKEAFRLWRLGHEDMIDNILYASALKLDVKLLSLDNQLKNFVREKQLKDVFYI